MPRRKSPTPDTERLVILREARERKQAAKRLERLGEERRATRGRVDMAAQAAAAQAEADAWNAAHEVGCEVRVTKDNGDILETITRSTAWELCGHASVLVVGISGGYSLERVKPMDEPPAVSPVADILNPDGWEVTSAPLEAIAAERERIRGMR